MEQNSEDFLPKLEQKVCENVVLFAKAETSQEKPDVRFKEAVKNCILFDIETFFISPIEFEWSNLNKLRDCLNDFQNYSGLILSSTRCVDSLIEALKNDNHEILMNWSKLDVFTVGTRTQEYLKTKTNLDSLGFHCGSGKELGNFIANQNKQKKFENPLLYPCSEVRTDDLQTILKENSIPFYEIFTYRTIPNRSLNNETTKLFSYLRDIQAQNLIVLFFSPTGVEALLDNLENFPLLINKFWTAFGGTTSKALTNRGKKVSFVCSDPTPESFVQNLKEFLMNLKK